MDVKWDKWDTYEVNYKRVTEETKKRNPVSSYIEVTRYEPLPIKPLPITWDDSYVVDVKVIKNEPLSIVSDFDKRLLERNSYEITRIPLTRGVDIGIFNLNFLPSLFNYCINIKFYSREKE